MDGKKILWSDHALDSLTDRNIPKELAQRAIDRPEQIKKGYNGRKIFQCRGRDAVSGKEYLFRAVMEEKQDLWLVVTVYKTSQIAKYAGGEGNESELRH